jgi:hypothetical protein
VGELRGLTGHQVVGVLRERYSAEARAHAEVLEAVWETARCVEPDSTRRLSDKDEWSNDEVRVALGLTRNAAARIVTEAFDVVHRLPELHDAMAAGDLDPARARIFGDWTAELAESHAISVVNSLLPRCRLSEAARLTTGQLVDRIKTMAIALDPDWARRRYEAKLEQRKLVATRESEGTATLSGKHLPVERVAASSARYERLALAAKRGGDRRPIDHIRADLYLGVNDGTYAGLSDEQILTDLLASTVTFNAADESADESAAAEPDADESAADPEPAAPAPSAGPSGVPAFEPVKSWAGVQLRVRLSTLLGLDRNPGELAGWGSCHAELAQQMVREMGAAQWRYIFTCPDGWFVSTGLLRSRPTGSKQRRITNQGVIEIVVPVDLLPRLFGADGYGDLAATVAPDLVASWGGVLADLHDKLAEPETRRLLDPTRRFPGAALRREVLASLKTCVGSGCRAPAASGEVDHRKDHAKGGLTVEENLNPMCKHDHRVKTEAGWQLRRVDDTFEWTTRLGHVYLVPVPPVLPDPPRPPEPRPPKPGRDLFSALRHPTPWDESQHGPPPF